MTKEEAKEIIIKERDSLKANSIVKVEDCLYEAFDLAIKVLEQQPNRCDSCIHSEEQDGSNCYECIKGIADNFEAQQTDADCISRQEVEEMIKAEMPERGMWEIEGDKEKETVCEVCVDLMQKLSELPPVSPQPKIGQWIKTPKAVMGEGYMWYCDKCEHQVYQDSSKDYPSEKYCPNCGARMAESEDKE